MRKGISFYFGFDVPPEERARMIAEAGFDSVITSADKTLNRQNWPIAKQMKLFKKYGLRPSSLHMAYKSSELHYFWEPGRKGEQQVRSLIRDVKLAHKYGFSCVVVHLKGEYSALGEARLCRVLQVCEKLQVPLAIENVHAPIIFWAVMERIKHPYLRFCYDSGHNHAFDPAEDYLTKCGDKLMALHLHDNDGTADQHTLNRFGNIDWAKIAKQLVGKNVSLDYELLLYKRPEGLTAEAVLRETKQQADELEAMITK